MKKRIGLVTYSGLPELHASDRALIPLIEAKGWEAFPVIWDDPTVDWSNWDALLIRNPWDYYEKPQAFQEWLAQLTVPLWNSLDLVQWNFHKFYLQELESKGVPIIPTIFYEASASSDAPAIPWEQIVCKPAISAGSYQTQRLNLEQFTWPTAGDWLIQPFIPEIQTDGEYSMIYFGNTFSHAIKKQPVAGDFRVQRQYGGYYSPFEPTSQQWEVAQKALEAIPFSPVYARVDGVMMGDQYRIMEIEMIEPDLYFEFDARYPARLIDALFAKITN